MVCYLFFVVVVRGLLFALGRGVIAFGQTGIFILQNACYFTK